MIDIIMVAFFSSGLTIFINYCLGRPGDNFSTQEIFSFYTVWLSRLRLKKIDLLKQYEKQYNDNLLHIETRHEAVTLKNDYNKILYEAAEPFFTWERAAGMCSICSGVWLSLFCGICFTGNLIYLLIIMVISHIVIRILNKIL